MIMRRTAAANAKDLWRAYRAQPSVAARNSLVEFYLPLVRGEARKLRSRLSPQISDGDLISAGFFGLLDAIRRFDAGRGFKFETFAAWRIRGAMLDEARTIDWLSRNGRHAVKRLDAAIARLTQRLGRPPQEPEVAEELGVSPAELGELCRMAHAATIRSIDRPARAA
jgi:RNA polymerase sigma factor for flagellar operon FliA